VLEVLLDGERSGKRAALERLHNFLKRSIPRGIEDVLVLGAPEQAVGDHRLELLVGQLEQPLRAARPVGARGAADHHDLAAGAKLPGALAQERLQSRRDCARSASLARPSVRLAYPWSGTTQGIVLSQCTVIAVHPSARVESGKIGP
jgi:hypothetical protein